MKTFTNCHDCTPSRMFAVFPAAMTRHRRGLNHGIRNFQSNMAATVKYSAEVNDSYLETNSPVLSIRPLLKLLVFMFCFTAAVAETVEVCSGEVFSARCGPDEVIVMDTAIYGRMNVGKCIPKQQDHMGCSNEVLALADRWCSGRRSCQTIIPNPELDVANQDCLEYLKLYFEATYHCIKVFAEEPSKCETLSRVTLPANHGFISSQVTDETGCVSLRAPGIIHAASGQRIKFTLLDFATTKRKRSAGPIYGYIMDKTVQINKTIYGGGKRQRDIYTSESAVVEIALSTKDERHQDGDFLLQYQAVGCADLDTPPDAWYKRKGDNATIGCKNNPKIWHLRCDGQKWQGTVGNCSLASIGASTEQEEKTGLTFSKLFFIITGVAAAIVLLVIVVVVACVCHKKKSINDESRRTVITPTSPTRSGTTPTASRKPAGKYKSIECTGPEDLVYNVNARHQPITFNKDGISAMCDRPRLEPNSALAQVIMLTQPEPAYQPNTDLLDLNTPSPTEGDAGAAGVTSLGPPPPLPECPPPSESASGTRDPPPAQAQYEIVQVKMRPKSIYKDGSTLDGATSRVEAEPSTPATPPLPTRKSPLSLVSSSDSSPTSPEPPPPEPEEDSIYVNESVAKMAAASVGSPPVPRRPPRKCDDGKLTGNSTRTPSPGLDGGESTTLPPGELAAQLAQEVGASPSDEVAEPPPPPPVDDLPPPPPPPEENYYNLDELTGVPKEDPTIPLLPDPPLPPPAPTENYYSNDPDNVLPVSHVTTPPAASAGDNTCGECYYNNCDCPGEARKANINV